MVSDDEKVVHLVDSILRVVNESQLPLSVKALALDNVLLNVKMAMQTTYVESNTEDQNNAQSIEDANDEGDAQNAAEAT